MEGKESATEKVTLLKEATVEKVNSMKENVNDAIAFESDSPVRKNLMHPGNYSKFDGVLDDPDGDHDDDVAGLGGDLVWPWLFWQGPAGRVPGFKNKSSAKLFLCNFSPGEGGPRLLHHPGRRHLHLPRPPHLHLHQWRPPRRQEDQGGRQGHLCGGF